MSKISANAVFHFTKLEALAGILRNGFYPFYSTEEYPTEDGSPFRLAIPMVCFCDIPLSQIANHIEQYGRYGIGISKTWAIKKRLNPVLYLEKSSLLWHRFESVLDQNTQDIRDLAKLGTTISSLFQVRHSLMYVFTHTKPYEGFQHRDREKKHKRFYDEREWRHVPNINPDELFPNEIVLFGDELSNAGIEKINALNTLLRNYSLTFEWADIQYLIVEQESERPEMLKMLSELGSQKYGEEETKILSSRIISAEQIMNDI